MEVADVWLRRSYRYIRCRRRLSRPRCWGRPTAPHVPKEIGEIPVWACCETAVLNAHVGQGRHLVDRLTNFAIRAGDATSWVRGRPGDLVRDLAGEVGGLVGWGCPHGHRRAVVVELERRGHADRGQHLQLRPVRAHPGQHRHDPQPLPIHQRIQRRHRRLPPRRPLLRPQPRPLHPTRPKRTRTECLRICERQSE